MRLDQYNLKHVQRRGIDLCQDEDPLSRNKVSSSQHLTHKPVNAAFFVDDIPIGHEIEPLKSISCKQSEKKLVSANFDEVDDIYFEKDPIGASL